MPITQVITTLPTPPNAVTDDSTTFSAKADASLAAQVDLVDELNDFATQANTLETNVTALEASATTASGTATTAAGTATAASGAASGSAAAASTSEDNAAVSEANALSYLTAYRATSYGALAADPALDPNGNPCTEGDEYFNTVAKLIKRFNGATWQASDISTANLAASSGSSLVGFGDLVAPAYLKTVSDILNGERVDIFRNIPAAQHAAIRARTSVYDVGPKMQELLDEMYDAKRNGELFLGYGTYPMLTMAPRVWTGLTMTGSEGSIIERGHFLTGNVVTGAMVGERFTLYQHTGSMVRGITIDGRNMDTVVATFGVNPHANPLFTWMDAAGIINQTPYGDIGWATGAFDYGPSGETALTGLSAEAEDGEYFTRTMSCRVFNSCGSAMKNDEEGARGIIARDNFLTGYYDHAIYFAGWADLSGEELPILNCIADGNQVFYPSQTRGNSAFKARGFGKRVRFTNNLFNIPEDSLFSLDCGDTTYGSGDLDVTVSGNKGRCEGVFYMGNLDPTACAHDIKSFGNEFVIAGTGSKYIVHASATAAEMFYGKFTSKGNTYRTEVDATVMLFDMNGNTSAPLPAKWEIENETINGLMAYNVLGSCDFAATGGTARNRITPDTANPSLFEFATIAANQRPSAARSWLITNPTLVNYGALMHDDSDTSDGASGNHALDSASITVVGGSITGHPTRNWVSDLRGTTAAAYAGVNRMSVRGSFAAGGYFAPSDVTPFRSTDSDMETLIAISKTAAFTLTVPRNYCVEAIRVVNFTGNAMTGGLKIGTSAGATDVVAAQTIGAAGVYRIQEASILKNILSLSATSTLYFDAVTAWNGAVISLWIDLKRL